MRWSIPIVFSLSMILPNASSLAQHVNFIVVENVPEITDSQVLGMTQDDQGFLWLSTQRGLLKYDGNSFASYHHELSNQNSPAGEVIECLTADSAGFIWMAPQWMGLDRLDPASGIFTHFRHDENNPASLANDSVMALLTDHHGTLWIGTYKGLDRLDKGSTDFIHYEHDPNDPSSLSFNAIRSIYEDKQGTIWVGTGSVFNQGDPRFKTAGGLNKLNKATGKFTRYLHDDSDTHTLMDNRIRAIFEDSRGTFWIGSAGDGLHTMDRKSGKFERHLFDSLHPEKLSRPVLKPALFWSEDHISFITEDHTGKILIGTFSSGINVYDPLTKKVNWYGTDKNSHGRLKDELFWAAYKTRDNTVWVSSWGPNLYKIVGAQKPISYTKTNRITISFVEDDEQNLWTGTAEGLFRKDKHGLEEPYLIDRDHPASAANLAFPIDRFENKLVIQTSFGLYFFDLSTKQYSRSLHHDPQNKNTPPSDTIPRIRKTADGDLWLGTYRGLALWNAKSGTVQRFVNDPRDSTSIPNNIIQWLEMDNQGNLWIGSNGALCKFEKETKHFKRYPNLVGVIHIMEDSKGNLWAGGVQGLFTYDSEKDIFTKFEDEYRLMRTNLQVGWIMEDQQNNLWLGTSGGIVELRSDDKLRPILFGKTFEVNGFVTTSGYIRRSGSIIFGDISGYFEINPALLTKRNKSHNVVLTHFLLGNEPLLPGQGSILSQSLSETTEIRLAHNQNTFSFEFATIDFISSRESSQTIYRLENYDDVWRKANSENTGYYFNVPAGTYRFTVKSFDAMGDAAEKNIVVIITPPWWQTWWAYSLLAVAVIGMVYVIYTGRVMQLKKQQAAQIRVMVTAQEQERKRIARDIHDDVGTKLSALKMFVSSLHEKTTLRNDSEISALAESAEQFTKEVISDVRSLLLNLSPSVLEEFGYVTAVEGLVNKLNETKRVCFTITVFGMEKRLRQEYELALYRITQELINNILKHADANYASLQIGCRDDKIILMIEDDGKGFDSTAKSSGYGLQNLEARTKLMQGNMTIDSRPSKGTSVLIEIPYEPSKT